MKKVIVIVACAFLIMSCAAGVNPQQDKPSEKGETASFLQGLWHGFILPVTFVISLFAPDVNVYETHNNGGWYNFGFLLGAAIILGGGGGTAGRLGRRRG